MEKSEFEMENPETDLEKYQVTLEISANSLENSELVWKISNLTSRTYVRKKFEEIDTGKNIRSKILFFVADWKLWSIGSMEIIVNIHGKESNRRRAMLFLIILGQNGHFINKAHFSIPMIASHCNMTKLKK